MPGEANGSLGEGNLPRLTEEDIQLLCTERSFERGEDYYWQGAIREPLRQGGTLRVLYEGSQYEPYRVMVELDEQGVGWARAVGIKNWGYFIVGLPGETDETAQQTIELARKLPLDLALFHIAAPYPGTPFYREAVDKGWFRPGTRWEDVDMDRSTVLDYPQMPAERIEYWARRAFREWAFRPGPIWTYLTSMFSPATFRSAVEIGLESLGWVR